MDFLDREESHSKRGEYLSFVKKSTPPPDIEEGDVLKAKISQITKVTSQWKDDSGNPKEQLQIDFELENGYKARSWIAYYENPGDKSALGKLALKMEGVSKKQFSNVNDFLDSLKRFGYIYVKVKSFREYEDETYPNFSVVTEKLPLSQSKLDDSQNKSIEPQPDAKHMLHRFEEVIHFGLPLNEQDWNKNLLVQERLTLLKEGYVEAKDGLYHFTEKARVLFPS